MRAYRAEVPPFPPCRLPKCYHTPRQVEVLAFILLLLPHTLAAALVFLSCAFLYAVPAAGCLGSQRTADIPGTVNFAFA